MTRTPAARGHRHLFVGRPRQLRVAMNRGSAARTALFCHVWVMQASISKCSQLRGCSDWLRLWVVSRTRLRSRLHVWPLHWPAAPVPDQHSACHGYCRADLDVARAGTLPAYLSRRLVLMRARAVVLKICAVMAPPASKLSKSTTPSRTANPQSTPWENGPTTTDRPQSRCTPSSDPTPPTRTPSRINRMPRCTQPGTCARASGAVRPERRLSAAPSAADCSGARRSSWMSAASPHHVEPRQPVVQALTLG